MNGTRLVLFILGLGLVILAGWMLFFQTGLNRWVPFGVAAAGLLMLIGLMVIGFSESARSDHDHDVVEEHHHRY